MLSKPDSYNDRCHLLQNANTASEQTTAANLIRTANLYMYAHARVCIFLVPPPPSFMLVRSSLTGCKVETITSELFSRAV
jgi:hypothetical protein